MCVAQTWIIFTPMIKADVSIYIKYPLLPNFTFAERFAAFTEFFKW